MHKLGDQWIEIIDGQEHMLKAVGPVDLCQGCCFNCNQGGCCWKGFDDCQMGSFFIIKDLGILNDDGLLPCPFCGEYPKIGNFGDGFSDTTFYVKHNQSECVICGLMRTKSFKTRQQAIDAWNRRV